MKTHLFGTGWEESGRKAKCMQTSQWICVTLVQFELDLLHIRRHILKE